MSQTITITLPGHLPVWQFAREFERLGEELREIEEALTGVWEIDWLVDRVDAEGSVVTVRAVGASDAAIEHVINTFQCRRSGGDESIARHSNQPASAWSAASLGSLIGDILPGAEPSDAAFVIRELAYRTEVRCSIAAGYAVDVSALEGRRVRVRGRVIYDRQSYQIVEVQDVDEVTVIEPVADRMAIWTAVRGILDPDPDTPLPEETIRRTRDEW
jgi:hypothetical protein